VLEDATRRGDLPAVAARTESMANRSTLLTAVAAVALGLLSASPAFAPVGTRVDVGHGLSIVVPAGWRVTHRAFTPCSDPVERFSLLSGRRVLMLQERLAPVPAELTRRPRHFTVRGKPNPLECCSIAGRTGWVLSFGDHGRAFYAYLYPGASTPDALLRALDTFRAGRPASASPL
jgi:hypothetical protein